MSLFQKRYRLNGEFVTKLPVLKKKKKILQKEQNSQGIFNYG